MEEIKVVAAIIQDNDKILATRRSYGEFKGLWEFPGGKVEVGEDSVAALKRELKEELDTEVIIEKSFTEIKYIYPNFAMTMECYICKVQDFSLNEKIHDQAKWLTKEEFNSVEWLPADEKIINRLKIYFSNSIVVSACLLGDNCKYNGKNNYNEVVEKLVAEKQIIKICPEILTSLGIPRPPVEIIQGKIVTKDGRDMTKLYYEGVEKAWDKLKNKQIDMAILKANSPTCGSRKIYDGTFSHTLIDGNGILAERLKKNNITIISEQDLI